MRLLGLELPEAPGDRVEAGKHGIVEAHDPASLAARVTRLDRPLPPAHVRPLHLVDTTHAEGESSTDPRKRPPVASASARLKLN